MVKNINSKAITMNEFKRGLSDDFIEDLKSGKLKPILDLIKKDDTLCLQIRKEYINIYYRGGNILKLERKSNSYISSFNINYLKPNEDERKIRIIRQLPSHFNNIEAAEKWVENIPLLKQIMDEYFSAHSKSEREFQQLVARENNYSIVSNDTDYFITDIEYTHHDSRESRFDLVGINWKSTSQDRKSKSDCRIVLIEMKYGDGAIGGVAGIRKHLNDIDLFCGDKVKLDILKEETISSFKQLRELGLIQFGNEGNKTQIDQLNNDKPEFILLFANHKPVKTKLESELFNLQILNNADLKIATSNFMGYGLYNKSMLSVSEFKKVFSDKPIPEY